MNSQEAFLTPAQIAVSYPVSKSTIYSACQNGLIPHYRIAAKKGTRGKYLIKLSDFLVWLETNRREVKEIEDDGELLHIR